MEGKYQLPNVRLKVPKFEIVPGRSKTHSASKEINDKDKDPYREVHGA